MEWHIVTEFRRTRPLTGREEAASARKWPEREAPRGIEFMADEAENAPPV
jgi:hypothetical protein